MFSRKLNLNAHVQVRSSHQGVKEKRAQICILSSNTHNSNVKTLTAQECAPQMRKHKYPFHPRNFAKISVRLSTIKCYFTQNIFPVSRKLFRKFYARANSNHLVVKQR